METLPPEGYEADKWYSKNDPFMNMQDGSWYFRFIRYSEQGRDLALRFDYLTYGPFPEFEIAKILQDRLRLHIEIVQFDWEVDNRDRANQTESEAAGNSSTASTVADV